MRMPLNLQSASSVEEYGITSEHWPILQHMATELNVVLLLRVGKKAAVPWIRQKFPAKPKELAAVTTDPDVGLLIAKTQSQEKSAKENNHGVLKNKNLQWIVEFDGTHSAGNPASFPDSVLKTLGMSVRDRLIVDRSSFLPVTSDYDLGGIIFLCPGKRGLTKMSVHKGGGQTTPRTTTVTRSADGMPTITGGKPTQGPLSDEANLSQRIRSGNNFSNGPVDKVVEALNTALGDKRVMHGPVANLDGSPAMGDEDVLVIFPHKHSEIITSSDRWQSAKELDALLNQLGI